MRRPFAEAPAWPSHADLEYNDLRARMEDLRWEAVDDDVFLAGFLDYASTEYFQMFPKLARGAKDLANMFNPVDVEG